MRNDRKENVQPHTDASAGGTNEGHERWCNRQQHALRQEDAGEPVGCVGSPIQASGLIMGQAPGGWWVQNEVTGPARFALDWKLMFAELSVNDLRFAYYLLLHTGREQVDAALDLVTSALTEHDGQHPADLEASFYGRSGTFDR